MDRLAAKVAAANAERDALVRENAEHADQWEISCPTLFTTSGSRVDHECMRCDRPLIRGGWAVAEHHIGQGYFYWCWPCAVLHFGPEGEPRPENYTGHWHGQGCIRPRN